MTTRVKVITTTNFAVIKFMKDCWRNLERIEELEVVGYYFPKKLLIIKWFFIKKSLVDWYKESFYECSLWFIKIFFMLILRSVHQFRRVSNFWSNKKMLLLFEKFRDLLKGDFLKRIINLRFMFEIWMYISFGFFMFKQFSTYFTFWKNRQGWQITTVTSANYYIFQHLDASAHFVKRHDSY